MVKQTKRFLGVGALIALAISGLLVFPNKTQAAIGVNSQLNYQARLLTSAGATVPDGNYNIEFKIYQDGTGCVSSGSSPCSGTLKWTEDWLNNNSQGVSVKNGYLSVQLGAVTAFGNSVDWNQDSLWLSINVGNTNSSCATFGDCSGDGEMLPFKRLTASPYALNAAKVGGISASSLVQLSPSGAQTGNINITGSLQAVLATIAATSKPTTNQTSITNSGFAVDTSNVAGLSIDYTGGALTTGSLEGQAQRIDLTPGSTSGNTWNGLRIVANATGASSGVSENGIKLEGPTSPGSGTETGIKINSNWDVGLDIQGGGINLASATSDPSTPAADNLKVFSRKINGRSFLRVKDPDGAAYNLQPSMYERAFAMATPNSTNTITSTGSPWSVTAGGTLSTSVSEVGGLMTNFATSTSTTATGGIISTQAQFFRGSTTGVNGFFMFARVSTPDASYGTTSTGTRLWTGLSSAIISTMTSADTVASGTFIGFQYSTNRSDTNWQLIRRDGSAAQTTADTGLPVGAAGQAGDIYEMYLYVAPQGGTIYWRIDDTTLGTTQSGSVNTNLPAGGTGMQASVGEQSLSTTTRNYRMHRVYVEEGK